MDVRFLRKPLLRPALLAAQLANTDGELADDLVFGLQPIMV